MNKIKKLGIPADIFPTLDLLNRVANGEEEEIDIDVVTRHIAMARYYLRGKKDGTNISQKDKKVALTLIEEADRELGKMLDIVTGTYDYSRDKQSKE